MKNFQILLKQYNSFFRYIGKKKNLLRNRITDNAIIAVTLANAFKDTHQFYCIAITTTEESEKREISFVLL